MIFEPETLLKLAGTSVFAGAVAILATIVIERLGGNLGGFWPPYHNHRAGLSRVLVFERIPR